MSNDAQIMVENVLERAEVVGIKLAARTDAHTGETSLDSESGAPLILRGRIGAADGWLSVSRLIDGRPAQLADFSLTATSVHLSLKAAHLDNQAIHVWAQLMNFASELADFLVED